jgi:glycosyltransferase involved in cell wall biosynthesis
MMSVMERKNPYGLIKAFRTAFPGGENVSLVLKTSFGDRHPALMYQLRTAAEAAGVTVIDAVFTQDETVSLIDMCDCYVSLHRSEGLGLTMAEAMLLGKPVIATSYSGNVDFMTSANSLLVDYELVRLEQDVPPYEAGCVWAEPSVEHAASLMRRVYENPAWAAEFGAKAALDVQAYVSLDTAGQRVARRLEEIRSQDR